MRFAVPWRTHETAMQWLCNVGLSRSAQVSRYKIGEDTLPRESALLVRPIYFYQPACMAPIEVVQASPDGLLDERHQLFYRSEIRKNSIYTQGILANPTTSGTFSSAARPSILVFWILCFA